jgi:hypothetical protein
MTFGLKNVDATYQRAMNYIFHKLIGKIVEIYIDDVVIKSLDHESHLDDVRKTLECTRKHGLKMNPNKCAFGVSAGEFLGFLVHEGGIEVGKKSMKAIDEVVPPTNLKELQSLLQDQFCEKIYFKFVTKGVAFLSTIEDQERSEVCMG